MEYTHKPIMLKEIINCFSSLKNKNDAIFVDGTLGLAGHSICLAIQIKNQKSRIKIIGVDKDTQALNIAEENIKKAGLAESFNLIHGDFHNINDIMDELSIKKIDGILLDLGVSSLQLDDKSRGFSFSDPNQSLDMRMDKDQTIDAKYIVNNYTQSQLGEVLQRGEEKYYKKIASGIINFRKSKNIETIEDLLSIIRHAIGAKYHKKNSATDTFRALRIEVNDEISRLAQSIETMVNLLNRKGRLAIISFHSLEDRIIKHKFRELENPCICPPKQPFCTCGKVAQIKIITKKPIIPSDDEIFQNPRARSAKLRIVEKI